MQIFVAQILAFFPDFTEHRFFCLIGRYFCDGFAVPLFASQTQSVHSETANSSGPGLRTLTCSGLSHPSAVGLAAAALLFVWFGF